jgi:hypothetical protein
MKFDTENTLSCTTSILSCTRPWAIYFDPERTLRHQFRRWKQPETSNLTQKNTLRHQLWHRETSSVSWKRPRDMNSDPENTVGHELWHIKHPDITILTCRTPWGISFDQENILRDQSWPWKQPETSILKGETLGHQFIHRIYLETSIVSPKAHWNINFNMQDTLRHPFWAWKCHETCVSRKTPWGINCDTEDTLRHPFWMGKTSDINSEPEDTPRKSFWPRKTPLDISFSQENTPRL